MFAAANNAAERDKGVGGVQIRIRGGDWGGGVMVKARVVESRSLRLIDWVAMYQTSVERSVSNEESEGDEYPDE